MAPGEGDESDRDTIGSASGDNSAMKIFKCFAKTCKNYVCRNCSSVFLESCARRMKSVTILNEAIVTCCEVKSSFKTVINENSSTLSVKNSYLNKLLKEVEEKNMILIENNILLKEKLKSFEENAHKKLFS
ncbi:hypothetical protein WA026_002964 [Henosepilachna vigintioctopunctata]|uniref:Uncharacterized protein n=1 Tax=Henosepilachna vigintioctopunctata TaxID=420089 RepID=A0AAW1TLV3_9CUCU